MVRQRTKISAEPHAVRVVDQRCIGSATGKAEVGHALRVQVTHGEVHAVAQQVAGELAADVAEPDEADTLILHA